jgi:hypothetical protein
MGLYDRDYTQADFEPQFRSGPYARMAMPKITPVVKWLLIINVAVFLITFLIKPLGGFIFAWFSVFPATIGMSLQLWRQITYQFLHAGPWHIFVNMLVLNFFGPMQGFCILSLSLSAGLVRRRWLALRVRFLECLPQVQYCSQI